MNLDECKETSRGTFLCENGKDVMHIHNVYPPIQELQPRVLFVVATFVLFFIVGICGTSSILTIIRGIISERRPRGGKRRDSADNAILYIAALCIVDFLMSLSLPPAILDSIIGFWMFGTTVCKLHHVFGSVGKIISTFLITAMSFDRFVCVCHPYKTYYRSRKFIVSTIITLCSFGFILLLPMLTYASATEVLLAQHKTEDPITGAINLTRVRVFKCSDMMPTYVFYWFTSSTFILGYLVPLILIVYFNGRLIRRLYKHTKIIRKSGIPLKRIAVYTVLIAALYFLCWTPYWGSVLYAIYMSVAGERADPSPLLVFILYCVHLLPYFGSASNWILYGLLNTQLQVRHDVNQLSDKSNMYNNTNLAGSGSHMADDNISMSNLKENHVNHMGGASIRDGFLNSPEINRSASMLSEIDKKQNGSPFLKHNVIGGTTQFGSLSDLKNVVK